MNHSPIVAEDTDPLEHGVRSEVLRTHEVCFLDLSGGGVPDAVEHITRSASRRGTVPIDTVEETRRLEYGIGIDGTPSGVSERTTVSVLRPDERSRSRAGRNRVGAWPRIGGRRP